MILIRLILLPPKMAFGTTKLTWKTVRVIGLRRIFWVGVGVGIGLLVAPVPGDQMRRRLMDLLDELQGSDAGGSASWDRYGAAEAPAPVTTAPNGATGNGVTPPSEVDPATITDETSG